MTQFSKGTQKPFWVGKTDSLIPVPEAQSERDLLRIKSRVFHQGLVEGKSSEGPEKNLKNTWANEEEPGAMWEGRFVYSVWPLSRPCETPQPGSALSPQGACEV